MIPLSRVRLTTKNGGFIGVIKSLAAWHRMVLHGIALHLMILHSLACHCIVSYGVAWYCIVGFGTRAVSRKTPTYFIHQLEKRVFLGGDQFEV